MDGLLAFFGDPNPQEDHSQRAVLAALAMQQKAWDLKKEWTMTGGLKLRIRIGIHTGEVVVGNMGSIERMDYTVIGSHVNLAQRLESSCTPDRVLISKEVHDQLGRILRNNTLRHNQGKGIQRRNRGLLCRQDSNTAADYLTAPAKHLDSINILSVLILPMPPL